MVTARTAVEPARDRYVRSLCENNERLRLDGLPGALDPAGVLVDVAGPDGLRLLGFHGWAVPARYAIALYAFRLAEYLRIGFASADVAYRHGWFFEPLPAAPEVHLLALDTRSGRIARYLCLAGNGDGPGVPARSAARRRFPCEVAHQVDLLTIADVPPETGTDQVWEIKRLVQPASTGQSTVRHRAVLTLALMATFFRTVTSLRPSVRFLIGDGEEGLAIRRMLRTMRSVCVVDGTSPSLPADEVMHPLYTVRQRVVPFAAAVPPADRLLGWADRIDSACREPDPLAALTDYVQGFECEVTRVQI